MLARTSTAGKFLLGAMVIGGAAIGGAIGWGIGGGPGAVVGAVVGAIAGFVSWLSDLLT